MNPTRLLTSIYTNVLDRTGTLIAKQGASKRHREPLRALSGLLAIGASIVLILTTLQMNESQASNYKPVTTKAKLHVIDYQIYTLKKLRSIRQFQCAITLWNRESNWRPRAHNSGHWGIVQGRSDYLKTATAYEQIDWGLRYIRNRYGVDDNRKTNVCLALGHSYKNMWY